MDFIALIEHPNADKTEVSSLLARLGEVADGAGLKQLQNDEIQLPVWVDHLPSWRARGDSRGVLISAIVDDLPAGASFQECAGAGRRGPLLQILPEGISGRGRVASDPIGINTVYYREHPAAVAFSSRSSWLVPRTERRMNLLAAYHFLNFMVVPAPHSILDGVARLAPGRGATVGSNLTLETFWDLTYGPSDSAPYRLDRRLFEEIREAVKRSLRNLSAPEVGAFLSGGTDSTSVAAFAAEALQCELDVFSIIFDDPTFTEEEFIRQAAERFPLRLHSFRLEETALVSAIEKFQRAYDEPYANPSVFAAYHCFRMARECGKRVLLSGDGGDEIFGGNERYAKDKIFAAYQSFPPWLRLLWEKPLGWARGSSHTINRIKKIIRRANLANPDRFYADDEFGSANWDLLRGPVFRDARFCTDASVSHLRDLYRACGAEAEIDRLLYLDMKGTIADNDLRKIVRSGSIFQMEARFPLLDLGLVDFANHIPPCLKVRGLQKRHLFKRAMKGFLPDKILFKRKHGMGIPLGRWLRSDGPLSEYVRSRLTGSCASSLFNRDYLEKVWNEHRRGLWDHGLNIWRIVVLADWYEYHCSGPVTLENCERGCT